MLEMVKKYSVDLSRHTGTIKRPEQEVVLVTGTTGGLGSSLLVTLTQSPNVTRVYALNRKASTPLHERQKAILDERGYDAQSILSSPKVVLLESDMEQDRLGLSAELYHTVIFQSGDSAIGYSFICLSAAQQLDIDYSQR